MKDVILIGLGKFGEKTIETFTNILNERKYQMPKALQDKVDVHNFVFLNDKSFSFKDISDKISEKIMNTDTKRFNGTFQYVFVGDLLEDVTSKYGLVYSMLPLIFDQNGTIRRDKDCALGFFTFSNMIGRQSFCSDEKLSAISNFFRQFSDVNQKQFYEPPFTDVSGKKLPTVNCPMGPFTRNYILATPGDQNSVMEMTSQVFAERIFYELFYLSDRYKTIINSVQANRNANPTRCFSNFSMIQISRLTELQKYFLKYTLEDKVTDYLLSKEISGTNLDWYEEKFFEMIDIPKSKAFPIDVAVEIFMKNRKSDVTHLFPTYISKKKDDFKDYVEECRLKIEKTVSNLKPHYDGFVNSEIEYMLETLEKGWTNMFRINKLTGNINSYIKYVQDLKETFEGWTNSLKKIISEIKEISLEESIIDVENNVRAIQSSIFYKIPFFIPIRRMLIENAVLSLPLKEYLQTQIKKNIAQAFLVQWENSSTSTRNPVGICEELIKDLTEMKERLEKKKSQIKQKREFIQKIPSYYYIISQKKQEEYSALLDRIESRNFGPAKTSDVENVAKDLFRSWTTDVNSAPKDRQGISKDSLGFINHVDSYVESAAKGQFNDAIEQNSEEFSSFVSSAVSNMITLSQQLSNGSFFTENSTNYLENQKILVRPELDSDDELVVRLDELNDVNQTENVKNEFTLGSIAYFQDYLYMDYKNLQQYATLFKDYDKSTVENLSFTESPPPIPKVHVQNRDSTNMKLEAEDNELNTEQEYKRAALLDYCTPSLQKMLYNTTFAMSGVKLTEAPNEKQINALSIAANIDDVLGLLDENKLQDFARDFEIPRNQPTVEKQIEVIKIYIKNQI